ncbi:hypothetical protein JTF08_10925 [Micrococcaceae bacterium RIT802]|nr:hypothetical protein [Micrococcaceae bacterium RIT 802]
MLRLQLREGNGPEIHCLPDGVATVLNRLDIATVTPAEGGGWLVANIRKVGVLMAVGCQITIRPKIPVTSLFFLMGYSLDRGFWLDDDIAISPDVDVDLVNTIALTFIRNASKAIREGIIQGYESYEDSLPIMRGRIDIPAQIARRGGLAFPAQVVYDEFTTDVAENRLLLSAARRLLNLPDLTDGSMVALRKMTQALDGVTPLAVGQAMPRVH